MKFFEKKSVVKIAEEDLQDAKLSSIDFTEESVKKRAFVDVLGARLAMKLLFSQKIQANNIYSLYTIHNVLEELDMADIYYQGIKIDVRLVFNKNEIFIPKQHYEYDLLPDLYLVLCIKDNLSSAECLGFFEPKHLDKANANKDFYFYECENLIKPDKLKNFLDKFKRESNFEISEESFKNAESLFLPLVDKELPQSDKLELFKQLSGSIELREKAIEFENFEIISRAIAKDGTLLHDDTLDYVGGIEDEVETEIVEDGFDELFAEAELGDELKEELTETSIEAESDNQIIDAESLPEFDNEDENFDCEEVINNIYSEFEEAEAKKKFEALAETDTETENNAALIAGGAIVATAGIGLVGEMAKASASAAVASTEMQGALLNGVVDGAVEATVEGIKLGSELLNGQDLPEIENEITIDEPLNSDFISELEEELPEITEAQELEDQEFLDTIIEDYQEDVNQFEDEMFEMMDETLTEKEELLETEDELPEIEITEEVEETPDFETFEDVILESEELLETEDELPEIEEEKEEEPLNIEDEIEDELPEVDADEETENAISIEEEIEDLESEIEPVNNEDTPDFSDIEDMLLESEELLATELTPVVEDESEDEITAQVTGDFIEEAQEIADETGEDKTTTADMLHDLEALEDLDGEDLSGFGADLPDFTSIEDITETEPKNIEPEPKEEEEEEEEEGFGETSIEDKTEEPTEFADLAKNETVDDELPSFQDLVQKSVEEDGLPDFEYLVQNSIDETALPNFEHLVQRDEADSAPLSEDEPQLPEQNNFEEEDKEETPVEKTPIFGLLEESASNDEITPFTAHHSEEALLNEDLPKLNLIENAPQEKIQELQSGGGFESAETSLIPDDDDDDDKDGVFSLDDFDFKLLEGATEGAQTAEPEKDLLQLVSNDKIEKLEEQDDEDEDENAPAAIGAESDDFISQVDSFLGEVELSDEQRLLLANSLLDDDFDSISQNEVTAPPVAPMAQEPALADEEAVEFIENEEDQDLLKVLFEKEKIGGLSNLEETEETKPSTTPQLLTNIQNKKMVIAASIAGVVLVSFVVGGNLNSNQNANPNLPNNAVTTAAPTDGTQSATNSMGQPDNTMGDQMNGQMGDQVGGSIDGQSVQSLPGEDQQAQSTRDMGKAVSDAFSSEPVNASITKVAWEVPEDLAYNDSFRKYLQIAGKNLKLNLQNDLLLATEMAYSNKIIVDLKIAKDGSLQSENVIVSSGSKQIDKIVLQSVKETLKYLKMPSSELSSSSVSATLIINF